MKASTRLPGARIKRAAARQERFGRLAIERHDPDFSTFYFDSDYIALTAIYEAKPQAFAGAELEVLAWPVH